MCMERLQCNSADINGMNGRGKKKKKNQQPIRLYRFLPLFFYAI